eukprot:jgi/Mesvir1/7109/Mv09214-RA.2
MSGTLPCRARQGSLQTGSILPVRHSMNAPFGLSHLLRRSRMMASPWKFDGMMSSTLFSKNKEARWCSSLTCIPRWCGVPAPSIAMLNATDSSCRSMTPAGRHVSSARTAATEFAGSAGIRAFSRTARAQPSRPGLLRKAVKVRASADGSALPAEGQKPAETAVGVIEETELVDEISNSYLSYAMSVIVGRALPDARDGLKPVHRRILFALDGLGMYANKPFKKCARVVGEVLGKYHPHGDTAVYGALVRLAQDFSMRAPLIDGHGNFGSVDDDPAAAMRYTECRLRSLAEDMLLADLSSDTVRFTSSFDGSHQEPSVLPARLPNLLLNGSEGIAVAMATKIPPHNLGEIVNGLCAYIDNPDISVPELMEHIKAPDFPTGGHIIGLDGVLEAYKTGHGSFTLRGKAHVEKSVSRPSVVITELPYQVNKAELVERLAQLANDKVLEGVHDIRDESDRQGIRIVMELKRTADPDVVLSSLYKHTSLQERISCNMVAIVNGEPLRAGLKEYLQHFLDFRIECVEKRTRFDLGKAQEKLHNVQGFLIALRSLDAIIALIRGSKDTAAAAQALMASHGLSQVQADSVLGMPLRRLTSLEEERLKKEAAELTATISNLEDILANRSRVLTIIQAEARELAKKHGSPRRTEISSQVEEEITEMEVTPNDASIVVLSKKGYIKRMPEDTFATQGRRTQGKGSSPMKTDDILSQVFVARNHDTIFFFSARGKVYGIKGYKVPQASRTAAGVPLIQVLSGLQPDDVITAVLPISAFAKDDFLVMLTRNGVIKKTSLQVFENIRASGLIAIGLDPGDQLLWVQQATEEDSIIIASSLGQLIHFKLDAEQVRALARNSRGVRAMKLRDGAVVVGMDVLRKDAVDSLKQNGMEGPWVLTVTAAGYGKRVHIDEFPTQNRGHMGRGVATVGLNSFS